MINNKFIIQTNTKGSYRPDIDGLRAIAVVSVVLFHLGVGPFHGGFAGVDIFFVISGYLITKIIHKEIEAGEFTFANFYERRVRRIFPALFAMLFAVMFVAPFVLLPTDLNRLGGYTIATLTFASNILFWRQSGYFDPSSQLNPLLHTWSLAVEEQFYIGLPILMLLIGRYARRSLVPILLFFTIASFALCLYFQPLRPTATFYLAPFRAWELMLGALLAVKAVPAIANVVAREAIAAGALLMLIASLLFLKEGDSFPGWIATFPVVATALLIHTGSSGDTQVQKLLALRPLVFVGLVSYSLYLWHWPIIVYAKYLNGMEPLADRARYFLLLLIFILGWASYRWIERPFRKSNESTFAASRYSWLAGALSCTTVLALLGAAGWIDRGWQFRLSPEVVAVDRQRNPYIPYNDCDRLAPSLNNFNCVGGKLNEGRSILLWGDSHALAWMPAVDILGKRSGMKVIAVVNSACPPLFDVKHSADLTCANENDHVRKFIKAEKPDFVMMVGSWSSYSKPDGIYTLEDREGRLNNSTVFAPALARTLSEVRKSAGGIILVGPTPGAPQDVLFQVALSNWKGSPPPKEKNLSEVRQNDQWFWREANRYKTDRRILVLDPSVWFCASGHCRYRGNQGELLYRDGGHLSVAGARYVTQHFSTNIFRELEQE